jgi:putative thioredoxin
MSQVTPSGGSLRGAVDLSTLVNRSAAPAAASDSGSGVPLPGLYFDGTDANFSDFLELSM